MSAWTPYRHMALREWVAGSAHNQWTVAPTSDLSDALDEIERLRSIPVSDAALKRASIAVFDAIRADAVWGSGDAGDDLIEAEGIFSPKGIAHAVIHALREAP